MQEVKIVSVRPVEGSKIEKVLTPRPAFVLPIVYTDTEGQEYKGQMRASKKSDVLPNIADLANAATKGSVSAKVQGDAIICVQRSYSLR